MVYILAYIVTLVFQVSDTLIVGICILIQLMLGRDWKMTEKTMKKCKWCGMEIVGRGTICDECSNDCEDWLLREDWGEESDGAIQAGTDTNIQ